MVDINEANRVPVMQARRELTGLPKFYNRGEERLPEALPLQGRMEDGVRVLTYTLEAEPKLEYLGYGSCEINPVTQDKYKKIIEDRMARMEKVANIRFEKLPSELAHKADIKIFGTDEKLCISDKIQDPKPSDEVLGYTNNGAERSIIMNNNHFDDSFAHELGHAVGLSHPVTYQDELWFASGYSHKYNKAGTFMSYYDVNNLEYAKEPGPYDIAGLQLHYGTPKNTSPDQFVRTADGIPTTIYSEKPVTLDYRAHPDPVYLMALPDHEYEPGKDGLRYYYGKRMAFGTDIQNAIFTGYEQEVNIRGNNMKNLLMGGLGKNILTSKAEDDKRALPPHLIKGDTLVADPRAEKTWFNITEGSTHNTVTNFTPGKDTLSLPDCTQRLTLTHEKRKGHSPGTEVVAYGKKDTILASVFVGEISPAELTPHIITNGDRNPAPTTVTERKDPPPQRMARFHVEDYDSIDPPPPLIANGPASSKIKR